LEMRGKALMTVLPASLIALEPALPACGKPLAEAKDLAARDVAYRNDLRGGFRQVNRTDRNPGSAIRCRAAVR
jgi:hypothetical protein